MLHRTFVGIPVLLLAIGAEATALAQEHPCEAVREHARDTVIVFQPPSSFTVCRNGSVENGVVTDRNVYLELAPSTAPRMFDFRVRKNASDWTPMGLHAWEDLASKVAGQLRDLAHSGQPISELTVPLDAPPSTPLRTLAGARTRYVADVTPRYLEALHAARGDVRELPVLAGIIRRWCGVLATEAPGVVTAEAELRLVCAGPEVHEGAVERALADFEAAAEKERAESARARDATLTAVAHPDDGKAVPEAVRALDDARLAAEAVLAAAHPLREQAAALARDVATLRIAVRSVDSIRPGVPTYLATYSTAGNAELEIEASPNDIAAVGTDESRAAKGNATARFPIYGRHYFDIEAGIAWTGGVPNSPYTTNIQGNEVIQTKTVDEIAGLALVELEPLRFLWPERPAAGLLRLPVIGIPFTRDPTSNFFVGGGVGWTGVGSITGGPYLIRETTLRQSYSENETLPAGVPFGAVTEPGIRIGYFFSASIDLVGLFHLFVPSHARSIDALTGKEK